MVLIFAYMGDYATSFLETSVRALDADIVVVQGSQQSKRKA